MRWFDLIQNTVVKANNLTEDFPLVEINLDDVPEPAAPVVVVSRGGGGERERERDLSKTKRYAFLKIVEEG